ncbi:hypothetical protein ACWIGI_04955 [Nocardia sp. NPDC055321]
MTASPDALEARISELRASVRRAIAGGDRTAARTLRAELRGVETEWETAVLGEGSGAETEPETITSGVPVREHVHQALTLLSVPAAPRLIMSVHEGFFSGELVAARLTSLRRDEDRSFRTAPFARPYYVCAALTVDLLAPARGLMALSTWPLAQRMVGPLSARVDLLTAVIRLAEHASTLDEVGSGGRRVVRQLASTIPGVRGARLDDAFDTIADAARNELAVHRDSDERARQAAAERVVAQVEDPAAQLFGTRFGTTNNRYGSSAG